MKSNLFYRNVVSGISVVCILLSSSVSSFADSIEFGDSRAMVHYDDDLPGRSASFTADTIPNPMSGVSGGQNTGASSSGEKSSSEGEVFDGGGNFRPAPPVKLSGGGNGHDGDVFSGKTPFGDGNDTNLSLDSSGQGSSASKPESYIWHRENSSPSAQNGDSENQPSGPSDGQPNDISFDESGMTAGAGAGSAGGGQHRGNPSGEGDVASNDKLYIIPSHKGENTDAAIDEILGNTNAPLSAIEKAKRAADENRRAMAAPAALPKHVSRSLHLTLLNGEERPVIHLMRGNMTTIVFHDITGAKWEYHGESFDKEHFEKLGGNNASASSGKAGEEAKPAHGQTNIFCLQPTRSYSMGTNSTVFLDGLDVPVVFILEAGYSGVVDDYVDVTIAKRGPNAKVGYSELGITPDHDNFLQPFVDGVPPQGARKLPTSNDAVEAWMFARKMVIRTPYPLQSGFLARSDQVGGAIAYKVNPHLNFVTVSIDGVITSVEIQR